MLTLAYIISISVIALTWLALDRDLSRQSQSDALGEDAHGDFPFVPKDFPLFHAGDNARG